MKQPFYQDLTSLSEDERIHLIGRHVTKYNKVVSFLVESDFVEPGKADRYITKLLALFPDIEILNKSEALIDNVCLIKVGPKEKKSCPNS